MHVFRTYLWKEWREQRGLLAGLALGLALATVLVGLFLDWETIDRDYTYDWVVSMSAVAALVTVGSDLFGRERQGRQLGFLERLPAGLRAPFRAKLTFFGLLLCGAALYGALLAALTGLLFTGVLPLPILDASRGIVALLFLLAGLWVFAVSTWVPTSVMTLPAAAVVVSASLLPGWLLVRDAAGPLLPPPEVLGILLLSACVGGLVCARTCFVHAVARSRPRRTAVLCGLPLAALSLLPYTAWARSQTAGWRSLPHRELQFAVVGENARFAFLNIELQDPEGRERGNTAIVLNLQTREWSLAGTPYDSRFTHTLIGDAVSARGSAKVVGLYTSRSEDNGRLYNTRTGLPTGSFADLSMRASSCEPEDFGLDCFSGEPHRVWAGSGHALRCFGPDADKTMHLRTLDGARHLHLEWPRGFRVLALSEGFLIFEEGRWQRIDPDSRELSPFEFLLEGETIGPALDDGSLLVFGEHDTLILDPISGSRALVEVNSPGQDTMAIRGLTQADFSQSAPIPGEGVSVVKADLGGETRRFLPALLDAAERQLWIPSWDVEPTRDLQIFWAEGPRAIAVEGSQLLVSYDFDTDERRVLLDVVELELTSPEDMDDARAGEQDHCPLMHSREGASAPARSASSPTGSRRDAGKE